MAWGSPLEASAFRRGSNHYSTSNGYEIDFVTQDRQGKYELIQVCWDGEDASTREREERALRLAEKELSIPGKLVEWSSYLNGILL